VNLVGGGARSWLWPQILADVLNCRVQVLANPEDVGARGAAIIAGKALGWHSNYAPAGFFPVQASYEPEPAAVARYTVLFNVFRDLYPALQTAFAQLAQAGAT
jgi:sugar (pentulose or hexulose) kinase